MHCIFTNVLGLFCNVCSSCFIVYMKTKQVHCQHCTIGFYVRKGVHTTTRSSQLTSTLLRHTHNTTLVVSTHKGWCEKIEASGKAMLYTWMFNYFSMMRTFIIYTTKQNIRRVFLWRTLRHTMILWMLLISNVCLTYQK